MAIKKEITFEGNTYYLGNKDRVSAFTAVDEVFADANSYVKSGSNGLAAAGTSGNIFITSSEAVIKHTNATPDSFYVLCVKK